jgi:dihydrofolate reductase
MRKLILQMGLSLDGFVGRQAGGGWRLPPEDPALKERKLDWVRNAGLHVMGRVTYEEMAAAWPASNDAYAVPMNEIPKVVFSTTLERASWPDSRIMRDLVAGIGELKREPGKDMIAYGGATFAQALTRLGLVDEYRLVFQPVALGEGLPLFKGLQAPLRFELVDAQAYSTGTVVHVYRPAPSES